jgi:hypothetical protein
MKKLKNSTRILLIIILIKSQFLAQSDSSINYKGLETKIFYSVNIEHKNSNGKQSYFLNDKKVSKSTYEKYAEAWKNMETCCPCILEVYDIKNKLTIESVSCTDCGVGYYKEFHTNGKLKIDGHFKENPTGNWEDIWSRGFCSVPDGKWTYYNKKGDSLFSEFWENGNFIKQVPEQEKIEIWDVDLLLKGEKIENQQITASQLKDIEFLLKYKNSLRNDDAVSIVFEVTAIGYRQNKKTFTLSNFKDIDVNKMLSEVGIPSDEKTYFGIQILYENRIVKNFSVNVLI